MREKDEERWTQRKEAKTLLTGEGAPRQEMGTRGFSQQSEAA